MNLNPLIISALSSFEIPVEPDKYTGAETEYIKFNYTDERDELYANGEPQGGVTYIQVHYFIKGNPHTKKETIKASLRTAGFTVISTQQFYEDDTKYTHIVYDIWKED